MFIPEIQERKNKSGVNMNPTPTTSTAMMVMYSNLNRKNNQIKNSNMLFPKRRNILKLNVNKSYSLPKPETKEVSYLKCHQEHANFLRV